MPTFVVPVKSFRLGKQRLAGALPERSRAALGRRLSDRAASRVTGAGHDLLVVSSDPDVVTWADEGGYRRVDDPGGGLDGAAAAGVALVLAEGLSWVVLHSDLPLLSTRDIELLAGTIDSGREPIAPSNDGGTSAIGAAVPMSFAFGPGSFHRHLARLTNPSVLVRPGLSLDIDSPFDLEAAARVDPGWHPIG